jgi:thiol-disulfide isomerase/thioredoxin
MSSGAWIAVAAVVLALGFGLWRAGTDGRFRGTHALPPLVEEGRSPVTRPGTQGAPASLVEEGRSPVTRPGTPAEKRNPGADLVAAAGHELGERATLLQFSSAFCAPCRATRRVLGEVSELVEGVTHVEIDAEHHLDATRAFGILRTPTTVVLDASGAEVTRATGAPTRDQVLSALAQA